MEPADSSLWVTVILCQTVVEAHIVKGRLEAEGIPVNIADENFLAMDPFLAQGSNGFRIQVNQQHEAHAKQVLNDLASGRYAIDDNDTPV